VITIALATTLRAATPRAVPTTLRAATPRVLILRTAIQRMIIRRTAIIKKELKKHFPILTKKTITGIA